MKEKLYTLKEISAILQLNPNHLYIMCRRGQIPYINIGDGKNRRYRFDLQKVKESFQFHPAKKREGNESTR